MDFIVEDASPSKHKRGRSLVHRGRAKKQKQLQRFRNSGPQSQVKLASSTVRRGRPPGRGRGSNPGRGTITFGRNRERSLGKSADSQFGLISHDSLSHDEESHDEHSESEQYTDQDSTSGADSVEILEDKDGTVQTGCSSSANHGDLVRNP